MACMGFALLPGYGQTYRISDIADSIKKDASAVVMYDSAYVDMENNLGYTYSEVKVIAVLDASMEKLAVIGLPYSDREAITNFKAWLYDADGNLVKRSDMNDMGDISTSGINLSSSSRAKMLMMQKLKAPFIVKYTYNEMVSGTAFMPRWLPASNFNESIALAKLTVKVPAGVYLKFNAMGLTGNDSSDNLYTFRLNGMRPLKNEEMGPTMSRILPYVDMMADKFEIYSIKGSSETWNDIGKFINALDLGNDELKKVNDKELNIIFESKQNDREKVKALYFYLQHNFHFAGIESGLAGWKPEDVNVTLKKKYGDCKGLVTLLKALLKKAGIESYYTLVMAGDFPEAVSSSFPMFAFNHVVLCVPLKQDTVWLECTSSAAPFNYLYQITSGRNALLVYNSGARLVSTPVHDEKYNHCGSKVYIKLSDKASVITALVCRKGDLQDTLREVVGQNNQKITEEVIYKQLRLKNTTIQSFKAQTPDADSPQVVLSLILDNENVIRKTDTRVFVKTDLFTPVPVAPRKMESRTQPVYVADSYSQSDTLIYSLPFDYAPENFKAGETKNITSKFGTAGYSLSYNAETAELYVIRNFSMHAGTYAKEDYEAFREFLLQSFKTTCPELVLHKKG